MISSLRRMFNTTVFSPIYLDNHLIAVNKPYGTLTQSNVAGGNSLLDQTKAWLKSQFNKSGNIFLNIEVFIFVYLWPFKYWFNISYWWQTLFQSGILINNFCKRIVRFYFDIFSRFYCNKNKFSNFEKISFEV